MTWLPTFRRITSSGKFISEIDGFRFIAIAAVVLFHLNEQWRRYYSFQLPPHFDALLKNGERGVPLFFVISGFILALPFARHYLLGAERVSLKSYFLRRATRLEPPYVLSLLILALLLLVAGRQSADGIGPHLAASLFYLHNLIFGVPSTISVVTWSLEVEIQFYILVPCLAWLFRIRSVAWRRLALVFSIAALGLMQFLLQSENLPLLRISILGYLQFFLAGFLLADFYLLHPGPIRVKSVRWDLLSLFVWPLIFLMPGAYVKPLAALLVVAAYWAGFRGLIFNAVFSNGIIAAIGGMCYSIYLLHYATIAFATRTIGHHHPLGMFVLSMASIAATSSAFFLLIERPCMRPDWPSLVLTRLIRTTKPASAEMRGEKAMSVRPTADARDQVMKSATSSSAGAPAAID